MDQWKNMLARTNIMVSKIEERQDIPFLMRDPHQLDMATSTLQRDSAMEQEVDSGNIFLSSSNMKSTELSNHKANRLLGQHNFDVERLQRDLHQITPRAQLEDEGADGVDQRSQIIATTIHEALAASAGESEHRFTVQLENEWAIEKRALLESLRNNDTLDTRTMTVHAVAPSPVLNSGDMVMNLQSSRPLRDQDNLSETYFGILKGGHGSANLADEFRSHADEDETWKLVRCMDGSKEWFASGKQFLESQYRDMLQGSEGSGKESVKEMVVSTLEGRKIRPLLGSVRDVVDKFKTRTSGFPTNSGLPAAETTDDGLPLWALLFYCLRAGDIKAVKEYLKKDVKDPTESLLVAMLHSWIHGETVNSQMVHQLDQSIKSGNETISSASPWKRALVFMFLGGKGGQLLDPCINASIEDYLWIRLSILSIISTDNHQRVSDLTAQLQSTIVRNGASHFNGGRDPYLYTRLLLLCNLSDESITYLAERGKVSDAVHMMICLNFADPQLYPLTPEFVSNVLNRYSERFLEAHRPADVIQYYYNSLYQHNISNKEITPLLLNGIVWILLSTCSNMNDITACLSGLEDKFRLKVLDATGHAANQKSAFLLAVDLFIETNPNEALIIINRELVRAIRPPHREQLEWQEKVTKFENRYPRNVSQSNLNRTLLRNLGFLKQFLGFTMAYQEKRFEAALELLSDILPVDPSFVELRLQDYYVLDSQIREAVFSYVFECAANVLLNLYTNARNAERRNVLAQTHRAYELFFGSIPETPPAVARVLSDFY